MKKSTSKKPKNKPFSKRNQRPKTRVSGKISHSKKGLKFLSTRRRLPRIAMEKGGGSLMGKGKKKKKLDPSKGSETWEKR